MRRTLWWIGRLAFLLFAAVTLPGATNAVRTPAASTGAVPADALLAVAEAATLTPTGTPTTPTVLIPPTATLLPIEDDAPHVSSRLTTLLTRPRSVLQDAQVIALYGHPGVPVMGRLGAGSTERAALEAADHARAWDEANGDLGAVGALHLITSVAQPWPMADGSYLARLTDAEIASYVDAARAHGLLLVLDVQVGMADPLAEAQRLDRYLRLPFVHLALDPEFAMRARGGVPGQTIGSLGAADVNAIAAYLDGIVAEHRLPPKLLVLHQFRADMLTGTAAFEDRPGVQRVIDMDGWGSEHAKLQQYEAYALAEYAQVPAIKLFYEWDEPLLSVERLLALDRVPQVVIYQ